MYISFVALPLMKYAFFASLDETNGIFILKIWISSTYWYVIWNLWIQQYLLEPIMCFEFGYIANKQIVS